MTELATDVCALPLVQRVAAMLDRDPAAFGEGDRLPRDWHFALFNAATPQSGLRADGLAGLGVTLPDLGLPRIMAAGRRNRFHGDIVIGSALRRVSHTAAVTPKQGRSGRFAIVTIEHNVFAAGASDPVLTEQQDYVLREADTGGPSKAVPPPATPAPAAIERTIVPDETLLFRYSAITFNTHRIHYDLPYATAAEGYPGLVVNGGIVPAFLTELFRTRAGREPAMVTTRNIAPLFCGRAVRLCAEPGDPEWRLWAEDDGGRLAVELQIR